MHFVILEIRGQHNISQLASSSSLKHIGYGPYQQRQRLALRFSLDICCLYCRAQKLVDTTMAELGVPGPPAVPTRATCGAYLALRAEVIAMLELRKTLQHR